VVPFQPRRRERVALGRRFGQHFLVRKSILERIADAACGPGPAGAGGSGSSAAGISLPDVIEIGPGKGALTESLLARARKVVAIEIDGVLVHYLRQKFHDAIQAGKLEVIEGDVLRVDMAPLFSTPVIAGNLPYYITSPILERVFRWGEAGDGSWTRAVFLVQAEVAARITAGPGSRDFGYLSVLVQTYSKAELLFPVAKEAFRPPPKVESAVVRLTPRDPAELGLSDAPAFLRFAQACFRQKRKTLRNNLAPVYGVEKIGALPQGRLRAEQLSVDELAELYRKLADG
jgi:16S rRNA (adenine1518-N6/adenine1519-N6)-dimethyltransferase